MLTGCQRVTFIRNRRAGCVLLFYSITCCVINDRVVVSSDTGYAILIIMGLEINNNVVYACAHLAGARHFLTAGNGYRMTGEPSRRTNWQMLY